MPQFLSFLPDFVSWGDTLWQSATSHWDSRPLLERRGTSVIAL